MSVHYIRTRSDHLNVVTVYHSNLITGSTYVMCSREAVEAKLIVSNTVQYNSFTDQLMERC